MRADGQTSDPAGGVVRPGAADAALIVVGVCAVSTSGPLIAATAVPALALAFWRNGLAGAVLAPVVLTRRRAELRSLRAREWRLALTSGVLLAAHFAAWVPSVRLAGVATSTALVATQPVWVALISRARGFPVARSVWLGTGIAVLGALLLTGADLTVDSTALVGDGLAVLGGACAAGYVTAGGEVRRSVSTTTYTALCYLTAAALLLGGCLVAGFRLGGYHRSDWLILLALTGGAQLLGHSVFNRVLRTTSPTVVSLAILFEIPGASLLAALFLGQRPPLLALPGLVLLALGVAVVVGGRDRLTEPSIPVE